MSRGVELGASSRRRLRSQWTCPCFRCAYRSPCNFAATVAMSYRSPTSLRFPRVMERVQTECWIVRVGRARQARHSRGRPFLRATGVRTGTCRPRVRRTLQTRHRGLFLVSAILTMSGVSLSLHPSVATGCFTRWASGLSSSPRGRALFYGVPFCTVTCLL